MSKINKLLQRPWVQGTGIAILGVFGVRLVDYITGSHIINVLLNAIKAIGDWLATRYEVSLWFLILLPIIAVGAMLLLFVIAAFFQREESTPGFINYREDVFDSIMFRWDYRLRNGQYVISNVDYLCPKCKCLIVSYSCPVCGHYYDLGTVSEEKIKALILHRVQNK